jgi:hypothetical protein
MAFLALFWLVREGVIYVRAMSALRRVLRLEIPACIQEHNQPRTSGIGALCQRARLESTGLFVGFDRREVLWAFVNKWKLTRWLILHKPLAEGSVVFRYTFFKRVSRSSVSAPESRIAIYELEIQACIQ